MADLRQAAQQALEVMLTTQALNAPSLQIPESITALRAALAQEEPEPVAWIHRKHYLLGHAENMPPADKALAQGWEPLFTHPPRREWQSLSEEEINALPEIGGVMWSMGTAPAVLRAIHAIEAALKEKNND